MTCTENTLLWFQYSLGRGRSKALSWASVCARYIYLWYIHVDTTSESMTKLSPFCFNSVPVNSCFTSSSHIDRGKPTISLECSVYELLIPQLRGHSGCRWKVSDCRCMAGGCRCMTGGCRWLVTLTNDGYWVGPPRNTLRHDQLEHCETQQKSDAQRDLLSRVRRHTERKRGH